MRKTVLVLVVYRTCRVRLRCSDNVYMTTFAAEADPDEWAAGGDPKLFSLNETKDFTFGAYIFSTSLNVGIACAIAGVEGSAEAVLITANGPWPNPPHVSQSEDPWPKPPPERVKPFQEALKAYLKPLM
jgi:hypothetical protein